MSATPIVHKKKGPKPKPVADRFWAKVQKSDDPDGCWLWTAGKVPNGYGSFFLNSKTVYAHRVAYELVKGPIPEGLQIDHLCRVRNCVNPDHLEAVTCRENLMRGECAASRKSKQTHCKRGHAFTPENTYVNSRGHRACKACHRYLKRIYRTNAKYSTTSSSDLATST